MLPPAAASLDEAHAAIELWEFYKRRRLDPVQRLVVEVMMATRDDGLWAAPTTGREEPRQNGKGDEIEVVELWGLVQRAERILHTVHDAVLLATETQSRLLSVIDGHADLRRLKARAWRGTGQQMIEMRNGGIIWYRTRTGGGARGVDEVDRIVVDEAQHAEEEHLAAVTPTQLASANPQLNALGTAGIAGKSQWWWRQRKRALSESPGDFGYVGHTAEDVKIEGDQVVAPSVDAADRGMWRRANPALVAGRVGEAFFDEQLKRLGEDLFAREHLGVWDPEPEAAGEWAIPAAEWLSCCDDGSEIDGVPVFALEVSEDRAWSTFAAAGQSSLGEFVHGEVVDTKRGTAWVPARAKELQDRWSGIVAVAKGSPGATLVDALEAEGVNVVVISTEEQAKVCGGLFDAVVEGRFRHRAQTVLDMALKGAGKRSVGDAWVWSQKHSTVDISPLSALTWAVWLHTHREEASVYESRDLVTL